MGMQRRRGGGRSSRRRWKETADTLSTQQTLLFFLPAVHIFISFGSSSFSSFFRFGSFPTPRHSFSTFPLPLTLPTPVTLSISFLHHLYHSHSLSTSFFPLSLCGIVSGGSRCNRGLFSLLETLSARQRGSKGFEARKRRRRRRSASLPPLAHAPPARCLPGHSHGVHCQPEWSSYALQPSSPSRSPS